MQRQMNFFLVAMRTFCVVIDFNANVCFTSNKCSACDRQIDPAVGFAVRTHHTHTKTLSTNSAVQRLDRHDDGKMMPKWLPLIDRLLFHFTKRTNFTAHQASARTVYLSLSWIETLDAWMVTWCVPNAKLFAIVHARCPNAVWDERRVLLVVQHDKHPSGEHKKPSF